MNFDLIDSNIERITVGDTVEHNGKIMTVCKNDINRDELLGVTLFGDSYRMGRIPVKKIVIHRTVVDL